LQIASWEKIQYVQFLHIPKTINGRTTIVPYVSDKHQDLAVQTLYAYGLP